VAIVASACLPLAAAPDNPSTASNAAGPVTCPVTGVVIPSADKAAGTSTYKDKTYYFATSEAKTLFDKEPARYAAGAKGKNGRQMYSRNCAACHGGSAKGGLGPNLQKTKLDDAALNDVILHGRKVMPAFAKHFSEDDLVPLIAYLHAIHEKQPSPTAADGATATPTPPK